MMAKETNEIRMTVGIVSRIRCRMKAVISGVLPLCRAGSQAMPIEQHAQDLVLAAFELAIAGGKFGRRDDFGEQRLDLYGAAGDGLQHVAAHGALVQPLSSHDRHEALMGADEPGTGAMDEVVGIDRYLV